LRRRRGRREGTPPRRPLTRDAGSASLWGIALLVPVVLAVIAATAMATAVIARERVSSAADLVALAAARHLPEGSVVACEWAARVARANQVGLRACDCETLNCQVTTTLRLPRLGQMGLDGMGLDGMVAIGRARAGAA
jgi:secretion/DNA translocation related TadE-like protein